MALARGGPRAHGGDRARLRRGKGSEKQRRKRRACVLALASIPSCGCAPAVLNMELNPLLIPESSLAELGRSRRIQMDGERRKQRGDTSSAMCAR